MASVSFYLVFSSIQYMVCCNDIHLPMHLKCGWAPIISSSRNWDRIASWALHGGIRALPTLGAPLIERTTAVVESRKKLFRVLVISESRNCFYSLSPSLLWLSWASVLPRFTSPVLLGVTVGAAPTARAQVKGYKGAPLLLYTDTSLHLY